MPALPVSAVSVEIRDISSGQALQATTDPRRKLSELGADLYKLTGINFTTLYNHAGILLSLDTTVAAAGSPLLTQLSLCPTQVQFVPQLPAQQPLVPQPVPQQSTVQDELEFSQFEEEFKRGIWDDRDVDMFA